MLHETSSVSGSEGAPLVARHPGLGGVFLLYAFLAVLITAPVAARLTDGVPHDLADPLLNTWLLWWNANVVPFSARWWSGLFFHPIPGAVSFSESLVGLSAFTTPLQWLGASPLGAYNVAFILSFALSALSMHLLARAVGLSPGPCLVAGLAYGFAPHRAAHLAHLQVLAAYLIPLVFLVAHRFAESGRRVWLALFVLVWVLQGLTNGYFLAFVSLLFALWLGWFSVSIDGRVRAIQLLLAWALAGAVLAPVLVTYSRWHSHYGLERTIGEIESFSADVRGLFVAPPGLAHWPHPETVPPESSLFPGLTLLVIAACFVIGARRGRPPVEGPLLHVLAAVAAVAATVAAVTAVAGPWRVSIGGLALSVRALGKPISVSLYALGLVVVASRRLREARRFGSLPAFYLLAAVGMVVLAVGPNPSAGDLRVWDKAPYYYLLELPGFQAFRAPTRFVMPAVFCLTVATGAMLDRLVASRGRLGNLLVALAAVGVLWDGWLAPVPIHLPPAAVALPGDVNVAAVLELPMGEVERDTSAMYRGMTHRVPVVNGYSGFHPPHYLALRRALERAEEGVLRALREQGSLLVVVDGSAPAAESLRQMVRREAGARFIGEEQARRLYLLPGSPSQPDPALGRPIATTVVRGSPRRGVFDLGGDRRVGGVELAFGGGVSSLPAALTIEVGEEGRWTTVWRGPVGARALRGALRDPKRVPVLIETPPTTGRLLRLRVDGIWTIESVVARAPRGE